MTIIQHVSEVNFATEVGQSPIPVLVDFYADWCGPCRMVSPILEALAREFSGRVKVVKVNVDQSPRLAGYFGIQSIPTLLAFRDGQLVDKLVGLGSSAQLRSLLAKLTAASHPVAW